MQVDKEYLLATLGGTAEIETIPFETLADGIERCLSDQLDRTAGAQQDAATVVRRGVGSLFVMQESAAPSLWRFEPMPFPRRLEPMPPKPTLLDFFRLRFAPANHVLQSATMAMKNGMSEETILACLLHDIALNLIRPDHGWWGAQLVEPYVPEKVSWAIRYHQALRFYPDPSVGYEYPEMYYRLFGRDYTPLPHIEAAYKYARNHKWYMEARMITVNDLYSFDPKAKVSIDPFIDILGRHFKQPEEGLGNDNSPVSHMWRTIANPDQPL